MFTVRLNDIPEQVNEKAVTIEGVAYAFDSFGPLVEYSDDSSEDSSLYPVEVYAFHSASHQWYKLEAQSLLPEDRPIIIFGRSVVAYGHCAYLWGGWDNNPMLSGLYCFDTHSWTWSRPNVSGEIPGSLVYHSACVVGHRMYIFGGYYIEALGYVRFLDLKSLTWHHVQTSGEVMAMRTRHTASAIGTRMYVWGGRVSRPLLDDCFDDVLYYLETTTATWVRPQVEGVAPKGRTSHSSFVHGRELYIFGGYSHQQRVTFAEIHKYDLEKSRWDKVLPDGSHPTARCGHGCSVLGERVFIFGGVWRGPKQGDEENMEDDSDDDSMDARYLTDMHVLHLAPTLQNLCLLAVIDAAVDISGAPEFIRNEIKAIVSPPS